MVLNDTKNRKSAKLQTPKICKHCKICKHQKPAKIQTPKCKIAKMQKLQNTKIAPGAPRRLAEVLDPPSPTHTHTNTNTQVLSNKAPLFLVDFLVDALVDIMYKSTNFATFVFVVLVRFLNEYWSVFDAIFCKSFAKSCIFDQIRIWCLDWNGS